MDNIHQRTLINVSASYTDSHNEQLHHDKRADDHPHCRWQSFPKLKIANRVMRPLMTKILFDAHWLTGICVPLPRRLNLIAVGDVR